MHVAADRGLSTCTEGRSGTSGGGAGLVGEVCPPGMVLGVPSLAAARGLQEARCFLG